MRLRGKVPDKFVNGPELRWGLELYFEAYFDLDTERSHAAGFTSIPWSSIVRYAQLYDFDEDQTERLLVHIRKMDNANIKKLSDDFESKHGSK